MQLTKQASDKQGKDRSHDRKAPFSSLPMTRWGQNLGPRGINRWMVFRYHRLSIFKSRCHIFACRLLSILLYSPAKTPSLIKIFFSGSILSILRSTCRDSCRDGKDDGQNVQHSSHQVLHIMTVSHDNPGLLAVNASEMTRLLLH